MGRADRAYRYLLRAFAFVVILVTILWGLNSFLQPVWFYENNYHTYRSFYQEPRDTVETVFVGASMTLFGFSPMEMYEQDGICAYNLASTSQPPMMSYYWVKEAYRYHSETLDTVVMDVSMLRRDSTEEDLRKALDNMQAGPVKDEAIGEIADGPIDALTYRFPILGYHDRWSAIDYTDFVKYEDNLEDYARGYNMEFTKIFDQYDPSDILIPAQVIDPEADPSKFQKQSLYYFNKLREFCEEKGIRLVLVKTPSPGNWTSGNHNGVQEIADTYGLDFIDFEIEPLLSEIGYSVPLDSKDNIKHLNYYGAMKITRYISTYLSENCGNRDVRGVEGYAHMDDQLERYHRKVTALAQALYSVDIADYLTNIANADNYTALITVRDEATRYMTVDQRLAFAKLGLSNLSNLQFHDSYIGILTDGSVEYEQVDHVPTTFDKNVSDKAEELAEEEEGEREVDLTQIEEGEWEEDNALTSITYSDVLADGTSFVLQSGGFTAGNVASCKLDDVEYSPNERGINIVVYDNDSHRVVDTAVFDLYASSTRENPNYDEALAEELAQGTRYSELSSKLQKLYRYNRRYGYSLEAKLLRRELGEDGLYHYLESFSSRDGLVLFVATSGDPMGPLDTETREALASVGLASLPELEDYATYCVVIRGGKVVEEAQGSVLDITTLEGDYYTLTSTGVSSGASEAPAASIMIEVNGMAREYSPNGFGFNIVVYNPKLGIVVDQTSFNTKLNGVSID